VLVFNLDLRVKRLDQVGGIAFLQGGDRMLSAAQLSPPTRQLEAKVWNASPWPGKS
jgi:hypothetical protein